MGANVDITRLINFGLMNLVAAGLFFNSDNRLRLTVEFCLTAGDGVGIVSIRLLFAIDALYAMKIECTYYNGEL